MGQITKVTPDMIQVANNVTSTTIGNTTSGISLTFDSNGVITSAANVVLSVANTQLTGTITNAQLGTDAVSNTKIAAGAVEQYFADTGFEAQFRNRIINGDMRIDQRNAGASTTGTNTLVFPVDRFASFVDTDGTMTFQQSSTAPAGFNKSVVATTTVVDSSLASNQRAVFLTRIEGFNIADLAWGTASAKTVTLSFWVRSSLTGTFGGALTNTSRSYPFTYSISVADTWEQKSITIPGDTSGTWNSTNGFGIQVGFGLGCGTDFSGTANAWTSGDLNSATGAVSVIGTLDATWYITGVQLEVGSVATPFERRPYGTELALCQRYAKLMGTGGLGRWGSSTQAEVFWGGMSNMRASPTATFTSTTPQMFRVGIDSGNATGAAIVSASYSPTGMQINMTITGGLTASAGDFAAFMSDTILLTAEI
jgi:hypothetical protein